MLGNLIKMLIIVAVLVLIITIAPVVLTWLNVVLEWIIAQGKWGVIVIFACIIGALFDA
jgi:hypothetical protein